MAAPLSLTREMFDGSHDGAKGSRRFERPCVADVAEGLIGSEYAMLRARSKAAHAGRQAYSAGTMEF